ncbi:MAG TPA: TlpA disulfide reductase family protein [Acidimicrobiia bacterium]|nr:TlpA disulfide reductase family protein [Acidimicrobiia bacterium]
MNKKLLGIIGGVVGLALIVVLALAIAGEEPLDASIGYGDPVVTGDPLPLFNSAAADPVVGLAAPSAVGADWEENEVRIEADGRSKIIIFLAHWCPHCQAEVPVVQSWLDGGNLHDDVDMYSVVTSTDRLRPNWPPQDWLEEEGWTVPAIMDDEIGTIAANYGMSGTPFYVVLDGDNNVIRRISGEIGTAGLDVLVAEAQAAG